MPRTLDDVRRLVAADHGLDPLPGLAPDQVPALLREVFTGAGGTHDDWPTYDRVMAEERRCAILITPARVYGNP